MESKAGGSCSDIFPVNNFILNNLSRYGVRCNISIWQIIQATRPHCLAATLFAHDIIQFQRFCLFICIVFLFICEELGIYRTNIVYIRPFSDSNETDTKRSKENKKETDIFDNIDLDIKILRFVVILFVSFISAEFRFTIFISNKNNSLQNLNFHSNIK